jgi:hypothetical protein
MSVNSNILAIIRSELFPHAMLPMKTQRGAKSFGKSDLKGCEKGTSRIRDFTYHFETSVISCAKTIAGLPNYFLGASHDCKRGENEKRQKELHFLAKR